jgi:branched-chain amino acid aminotransferase
LKGSFVPKAKALVSVAERGFRFGDGVFETIRVHNGISYQLKLHLARLKESLILTKINFDLSDLPQITSELITRNQLKDGFLRISISRGIGSRGYLPDVKDAPTIVIETIDQIPAILAKVDLWVSSYNKIPGQCLPSSAKTMQGLNQTLARMEADENNCFESLLLSASGHICEGSSSNIFWFSENTLYTPSLTNGILPGTIRDAVIRLSPYKIVESDFILDDLRNAEEVFLTNSAWLVVGVKSLSPAGFKWENEHATARIKNLILQDIDAN